MVGDSEHIPLKLNFNPKVRLNFRGAAITSDAAPLACIGIDDAQSLTDPVADLLNRQL